MTLAAHEIERLTERVQELEAQTGQRDLSEAARSIQIASGSRAMR
jgi:hypothetical protein